MDIKVNFVLDHGLRADTSVAKTFATSRLLSHLTLASFQQRVELLRMHHQPVVNAPVRLFAATSEVSTSV